MKFMLTWELHADQRHELFEMFSGMSPEEDAADAGPAINVIGRWHNLSDFTGVAICETDDPAALFHWALNWNAGIDLNIKVVVDDDEARAIGRARFG